MRAHIKNLFAPMFILVTKLDSSLANGTLTMNVGTVLAVSTLIFSLLVPLSPQLPYHHAISQDLLEKNDIGLCLLNASETAAGEIFCDNTIWTN